MKTKPTVNYPQREIKLLKKPVHPFSEFWQLSKKTVETITNNVKQSQAVKHNIVIEFCKRINDFKRIIKYEKENIENNNVKLLSRLETLIASFNDILHDYRYELIVLDGMKWTEVPENSAEIETIIEKEVDETTVLETIAPLVKYNNQVINIAKVVLCKPKIDKES